MDLERDELSFFPMLYWPVTADQPLPSAEAYAKLNRYLRSGGMILFDTADAYGDGYAETVLGEAIRDLPRDELVIATALTAADGTYTLVATPLLVTGGDGAPARALLISRR